MDESKFCSGCGKTLEPGMQFCPQCGMVVAGSAADEDFKEKQEEFRQIISNSRRNWLIFLLSIYAIPVIIMAIVALVDASATASAVWSSSEFQDWLHSHNLNYTQQDIQNYITYAAALGLGSGICALISLIFVYLRKAWIIAVIACFAAAILCFWSVFGIIIGFMVAFMIFGSKDLFQAQPAAVE
jgi:predicted PurR-regulated permease PerM